MSDDPTPRFTGAVQAIYTTPAKKGRIEQRHEVQAVAGVGLEGDRYALGTDDGPAHVSLIEAEAIEAARRDYDLTLGDGEARRNIVTVGVPLNHLVGREFTVGDARLRGTRLCEPCSYLQNLTGKKVIRALLHRGGLYAEILSGGTIRPGDPITPSP